MIWGNGFDCYGYGYVNFQSTGLVHPSHGYDLVLKPFETHGDDWGISPFNLLSRWFQAYFPNGNSTIWDIFLYFFWHVFSCLGPQANPSNEIMINLLDFGLSYIFGQTHMKFSPRNHVRIRSLRLILWGTYRGKLIWGGYWPQGPVHS